MFLIPGRESKSVCNYLGVTTNSVGQTFSIFFGRQLAGGPLKPKKQA